MKKKKALGYHGKDRRKKINYTDEYKEDFYGDEKDFYDEQDFYDEEGLTEQKSADAASDLEKKDDEYIVAYSSENAVFSEYIPGRKQKENKQEAQDTKKGKEEIEEYEEPQEQEDAEEEYEEIEEYEEPQEQEDVEEYEEEYEEIEEYEEPQEQEDAEEYEEEYEKAQEQLFGDASLYSTKKINMNTFEPDDYAEDTGNYYEGDYDKADAEYDTSDDYFYDDDYVNEDGIEEYYDEYDDEAYYDDEYYDEGYENEEYLEGEQDIVSSDLEDTVKVKKPLDFLYKVKRRLGQMTVFDTVLASTGVIVLVAFIVILSMVLQSRQVNKQIAALAPLGSELKEMGIAGGDGLAAMADAALLGNFAQIPDGEEVTSSEEESTIEVVEMTPDPSKVSVDFVSVEKDLKIRFTDVNTGELIRGTVFEVTLTNAKGKQLVLTDNDMDGIIYAQNVNAGVFDAVVTSTDKYKFPTVAQQVTVKDKVEYIVVNVQDEVKTEKQIDVVVEDTEIKAAEVTTETEVLKDTVEWVESTKTPISGSESYLLVDKNTIADPSQTSIVAARMLFDTLNVSLDQSEAKLQVGSSMDLKGTEFSDTTEGDITYQYTIEWKSSDDNIASVSGGKVTAKAAGTAVITYTVTKKTITTTLENKGPVEETKEISVDEYTALSDEEKGKCTPIASTNENGEELVTGYTYKKVTEQEPEKKTSETTESASAECKITVEAARITSGGLELSASADSCAVKETLTIKPAKLVYTKQDGSTETLTENFPSIVWESSDTAVATVGSDGVVTGVKAGKVHITGKVTGVNGADDKEVDIRSSVEITVTEAAKLAISLDRTSDVYIAIGGSTTLVATVSNYQSDAGVIWDTSDKNVATVDEKGVVTGVAVGSVKITATTKEKDDSGEQRQATCVVTVNSNAPSDTTTQLKDKNGNQIYIKNSDGSYREAVHADYYSSSEFYIAVQASYLYTGWQVIDGKTYYYDKNGNVVTGTQIIQGVTYNFGTDGAIATSVNGSTFGIDVSRHNGTIDWNAVKASGVDYVIIRCGYRGSSTGVLIEDQTFKTNIRGATAAGLKVGVYVFSQAVNEVEAVKEASLAVSLVKGYNLAYPIFIDTEASGGRADKIDKATRTAVVNAFCQTVASAGYKPGIYASKTWFEDKLNMSAVTNCKIWVAQYAANLEYKGRYDMWQYSRKGKINGIKSDVDLNYSYLGY